MPVTLNFGNHHKYLVNERRLGHLLSANKEKATHMGPWDKLQDHFREDKKDHALEALYSIIHGHAHDDAGEMDADVESINKIYAFRRLQSLACPAQQDLFKIQIDASQTHFLFMVGDTEIGQSKMQDILNISDSAVIKPMDRKELTLFLKICEVIGSKITWHPGLLQESASTLRKEVTGNVEIRELVYRMLRPAESPDHPFVEWRGNLTEKEKSVLRCINAGDFNVTTQFSKIGYEEVQNEVSFCMSHPCISYLLHTYSPLTDFKDLNAQYLNKLNQDYDDYHTNKKFIDPILETIYWSHGNSLHIGENGSCRNVLLV